MNIGHVSQETGVPAKTIRYYEEISLVAPPRGDNGYRIFRESDVEKLKFISRARSLGFSIEDCRMLLSLYEDRSRASAEVKALTLETLTRVERKLAELEQMRATLTVLAERCHGDDRPDCPILDSLSDARQDPA